MEQTHQALVCLPCTSYSQERNKLLAVKVLLMVGFFELVFFGYNTGKSILNDTDMKHKFITLLIGDMIVKEQSNLCLKGW